MNFYLSYYDSPIGRLPLITNENALIALLWEDDNPKRVPLKWKLIEDDNEIANSVKIQLTEYFNGKRRVFDLPLEVYGTPFQKDIWKHLQNIPFGETRSYGQLAKAIGNPKASRAVGAANGKNPISIILPCHRVVGSNGNLTGFAGGVEAKDFLLKLEGRLDLFS
jgi:methylated-DNA-[protein]-cysteine S-methyltransferase